MKQYSLRCDGMAISVNLNIQQCNVLRTEADCTETMNEWKTVCAACPCSVHSGQAVNNAFIAWYDVLQFIGVMMVVMVAKHDDDDDNNERLKILKYFAIASC